MNGDPLAYLLTLGSRIKTAVQGWFARLRQWFRGTLLGRIFWIIANSRKDFKTKLPDYTFPELTEEQAKYFEELFCEKRLPNSQALKAFYEKYPRGQFCLPPMGPGLELDVEMSKLMEACCDRLYMEISPEGKKLYTAPNPFFRRIGEISQAMGVASAPGGR